jgi:hypothetical protein
MNISLYRILKENENDIDRIMKILEDDNKKRDIDYYKIETHDNSKKEWYTGLTFSVEKTIKDERWMDISKKIMKGSRSRKRIDDGESMNDLAIQMVWNNPNIFNQEFEKELMDTEYMGYIFLVPTFILEEESQIEDDRIIYTFRHSKYDLWVNPFTIQLNIKRIVESKRKKVIEWMIRELNRGNDKDLYRNKRIYLKIMMEYLIFSYQFEVIELFLEMEESMNYDENIMKELVSREDMEIEDLMMKIWKHPNKRMRDESIDILYKYSIYGWYRLMKMIVEERNVEDFVKDGWIWLSYFQEFYKREECDLMRLMKERIEDRYLFLKIRNEIWYKIIDYF